MFTTVFCVLWRNKRLFIYLFIIKQLWASLNKDQWSVYYLTKETHKLTMKILKITKFYKLAIFTAQIEIPQILWAPICEALCTFPENSLVSS
jgi:hypothetical protein